MKPEENAFPNPFEVLIQGISDIKNMLEKKVNQPEQAPKSKYLTLDEFRELHPAHPARQTVYNWTHSKTVPFVKSGKRVLFIRSEIEKFIEDTCK